MRLQETTYRLALDAGWKADIEVWGPQRRWIADVLLAPPWTADDSLEGRIAVEIQLSAQPPEEFRRRFESTLPSTGTPRRLVL